MSNWIQLTSGGGYDFEDKMIFGPFRLEDDLAWPLTQSRYTRHLPRRSTWPVTLHSVAVARTIEKITGSKEKAGAGLLHDAHEAVIGDITTPVGRHLDAQKVSELKHDVDVAIFTKLEIDFNLLPTRHADVIPIADAAALHVERRLFTAPAPRPWRVPVPEPHWMRVMYEEITALLGGIDISDEGFGLFIQEFHRLVPTG